MGYWDKKESGKGRKTKADEKITLEEFEKGAQEKIESEANYLSRKIKEQSERFSTVTSDGFWFCVYFNNDNQKKEFLRKLDINQTDVYVNGKEFAKKIKMKLEQPDFDYGEEKRPVDDFKKRARPVKDQH